MANRRYRRDCCSGRRVACIPVFVFAADTAASTEDLERRSCFGDAEGKISRACVEQVSLRVVVNRFCVATAANL